MPLVCWLSPVERRDVVANKKLCFVCLSSKHLSTSCKSERKCRFCDHSHNSLLHLEDEVSESQLKPGTQIITTNNLIGPNQSVVLLATAVVRVRASNGEQHELRAFFDNGSQTSFISEHAVQLLKLPRRNVNFEMTGVGESSCRNTTNAVTTTITLRFNDFTMSIDVLVLRRVTRPCALPPNVIPSWPHLTGLKFADPEYQHPKRIDLLIGAEMCGWSLLSDIRKGQSDEPVAQNTQFGWIISGSTNRASTIPTISINDAAINCRIDECIERFWSIEDIEEQRSKTLDEERCENLFQQSTYRDDTVRFHVRIPFL